MKQCCKCKIFKNDECFSKNSSKSDGLMVWCKICQKEYRDKYYLENRNSEVERKKAQQKRIKDWFEDYRLKLACEKCGENHPAVLDFHHKNEGGSVTHTGYC